MARDLSTSDFEGKYKKEGYGPKYFGPDYGVGLIVEDRDGQKWRTVRNRQHVELDISSWRGISIGAVHFYARLRSYSHVGQVHPETGEPRTIRSSSDIEPDDAKSFEIEIQRRIDKRDIDHFKSERRPSYWRKPQKGDYTRQFWTEEEAIEGAKKFFQKYFDESWTLLTHDAEGNYINAITGDKIK